jgi:hypothetical protein
MKSLSKFALSAFVGGLLASAAFAGPGPQFWQHKNPQSPPDTTQSCRNGKAPCACPAACSCPTKG